MAIFGHYVPPRAVKALEAYRYTSGELTALDKALTPYWEFCVSLVPMWVAPNLLTAVGFALSIFSFFLLIAFAPTSTEPLPFAVAVGAAVAYFAYQTLDAIDGKQARRTGSSSPLGTLFDHGCDIITCTSMGLAPVLAVGAGAHVVVFAAVILSSQCMQLGYLWWEYYFQVFYSNPGWGTGVTEAQCAVMWVLALSGAVGQGCFSANLLAWAPQAVQAAVGAYVPVEWTNGRGFMILFLLLNNGYALLNLVAKGLCRLEGAKRRVAAVAQLAGFGLFVYFEAVFYKYATLVYELPHAMVYTLMVVVYSALATRLLLSSCCRRRYLPLQWPAIPFAAAAMALRAGVLNGEQAWWLVVATLCFQLLYLADLLYTSVQDICQCLRVSCFRIQPPTQDSKKRA